MTSLLTHIETASSQSNSQQQATEDIQLHIPKFNDTEESQFSNLVKPSSLLAKRLDISELGDLITKRVKTQSTNVSDNGSIADSPTSKKNPLANEKDKNSTDDAVSTTFTRCSSSESALGLPIQDSFTGSPVVIDIDTQSEESGVQLQLALNLLRERMIEQEAQNLLEMFLVAQLCQEPLYIPPLVETPTTLVEPVVAKKQPKKEFKKMELDHEVTYGTVEYPFLSISAPFPEDGDLSSIPKLDLSRLTMAVEEDPYADLTCKDPYLDEQIPVAFSNIEKKMKKTEKKNQASSAPRSPSSTQSSSEKKKSAKGKEEKNGKKVVEKVQKKGKEDKKIEKEVVAESSKTVKQDNIYARPAFGRRFTQRTKNKWQIAQDEKVKDIVLPALNFNGGYELFFEGNKKKPVPIGEEYQTDMSIVALQSKSTRRRKPQMKWDPSSHCEGELKKFFNKVKTMAKGEINEEKVVGMILDNENDLKRALKHITANKAKCLDTLRC